MMALGHFFLAIELPIFFFSSLALIIVGNGFFKPNISTFVGTPLQGRGCSQRLRIYYFLHGHQYWRSCCTHFMRVVGRSIWLALWILSGWNRNVSGPLLFL